MPSHMPEQPSLSPSVAPHDAATATAMRQAAASPSIEAPPQAEPPQQRLPLTARSGDVACPDADAAPSVGSGAPRPADEDGAAAEVASAPREAACAASTAGMHAAPGEVSGGGSCGGGAPSFMRMPSRLTHLRMRNVFDGDESEASEPRQRSVRPPHPTHLCAPTSCAALCWVLCLHLHIGDAACAAVVRVSKACCATDVLAPPCLQTYRLPRPWWIKARSAPQERRSFPEFQGPALAQQVLHTT